MGEAEFSFTGGNEPQSLRHCFDDPKSTKAGDEGVLFVALVATNGNLNWQA